MSEYAQHGDEPPWQTGHLLVELLELYDELADHVLVMDKEGHFVQRMEPVVQLRHLVSKLVGGRVCREEHNTQTLHITEGNTRDIIKDIKLNGQAKT